MNTKKALSICIMALVFTIVSTAAFLLVRESVQSSTANSKLVVQLWRSRQDAATTPPVTTELRSAEPPLFVFKPTLAAYAAQPPAVIAERKLSPAEAESIARQLEIIRQMLMQIKAEVAP